MSSEQKGGEQKGIGMHGEDGGSSWSCEGGVHGGALLRCWKSSLQALGSRRQLVCRVQSKAR